VVEPQQSSLTARRGEPRHCSLKFCNALLKAADNYYQPAKLYNLFAGSNEFVIKMIVSMIIEMKVAMRVAIAIKMRVRMPVPVIVLMNTTGVRYVNEVEPVTTPLDTNRAGKILEIPLKRKAGRWFIRTLMKVIISHVLKPPIPYVHVPASMRQGIWVAS
jgi:hypothetical protein